MDDTSANAKAVLAMKEALETKSDIYGLHPETEKRMLNAMNALEARSGEWKAKMRPITPSAVTHEMVLAAEAAWLDRDEWLRAKANEDARAWYRANIRAALEAALNIPAAETSK